MSDRKRSQIKGKAVELKLQLFREEGAMISCIEPDNPRGYLWIGSDISCYGVVADKDIETLSSLCQRILAARGTHE